MKIALIAPHFFMWQKILNKSIFAPGPLAIDLANGLVEKKHKVDFYTCGPVNSFAYNRHLELSSIIYELKKHNFDLDKFIKYELEVFHKLFKIIELEVLSRSFARADKYDILHVYITNGPEGPLFSKQIKTPSVFTLHDPFKLNFPNESSFKFLQDVNFTSISNNQRRQVPSLNIVRTIYNGLDSTKFKHSNSRGKYFLSIGRIIKPKGVHHAINACIKTNQKLKIAGIHYEGHGGDNYWSRTIKPRLKNKNIEYIGFIRNFKRKISLLRSAKALLFPITWNEPFGMVILEANACGTPVIAFNRGAAPEIIKNGINGFIVNDEVGMIDAMNKLDQIDRDKCREFVEKNFSLEKMLESYESLYQEIIEY